MNTEQTPSDPKSDWQKTPFANLIRYEPSQTYFARLRVKGKLIRRSLKTKTLTVAKLRLADLEKAERKKINSDTAKIDRLDFLKIDTEGFEDCVLAGAVNLLQKYRPIVYLELSSEYIEPSRRAVKILRDIGYLFQPEPELDQCHTGENFIAFHKDRSSQ